MVGTSRVAVDFSFLIVVGVSSLVGMCIGTLSKCDICEPTHHLMGGREERSRTAIALTILVLLLILSTSKYLLNLID